jgi:hypothetical protein
VGFHCSLNWQFLAGFVGYQRVIAAPVKGFFKSPGVKDKIDTEVIGCHGYFLPLPVFRLAASALVLVGDNRLVFDTVGKEIGCLVFLQGIKGIGQAVVKVLMGLNIGQQYLQHGGFSGKAANPVKLHDLEQDACNHGNAGFAMG